MLHYNPGVRAPWFIRILYKNAIWKVNTSEKVVYLTFDDGPVPEVTPWVLSVLKNENIKAGFFCVGENVHKHPELFRQLLDEGHTAGNHTFNHIQGLKTNLEDYLTNVEKADRLIGTPFFRPPHGFLKRSQYRQLKKKYRFVMWDVLSRDFDKQISAEKVYSNVMNFVRPGSVIVFHDSLKAEKNIKEALPKVIRSLKKQGYRFEKLKEQTNEKS